MLLKDKVAFVTGGSRGIGRSIVDSFIKEGANVFFSYNSNHSAAKETIKETGLPSSHAVQCHVCNRTQLRSLFTEIDKKHGKLDILVNNAGINKPTDFDQITDEDWDNVLQVNLKGPFIVTQEAIPLLRKSGAGSVINIGSVPGQYGGPRTAHYAASKAGLISLSQVIARFLSVDNIRCNTIAAGLIKSEMAMAGLNSPQVQEAAKNVLLKRLGTYQEISDMAVFLASDRSSYITAQTLNINGGLYF